MSEKRSKAAKKAAKTRAINRAWKKRFYEIEEPAMRRLEVILNAMLEKIAEVRVRFNPLGESSRKLKHGAGSGRIVKFKNGGRIISVLINGYRQPQDFHLSYWEFASISKINDRRG